MRRNLKTPADWQLDSRNVKTAEVAFYTGGIMATAQLPLDQARTMVDENQAFVISETSIGLLTEGRMDS